MKTPQEKKALSYERDRRNAFDGNDKAARKAIPRRKRLVNQANRHDVTQSLQAAVGIASVDSTADHSAEERVLAKRPRRWSKEPDTALGQYLADKAKESPRAWFESTRSSVGSPRSEAIEARYLSPHAIKTELRELLRLLRPNRVWSKRVTLRELAEFTLREFEHDTADPQQCRAVALAWQVHGHERR